jgi:hypothetical protein
MHLNFSRPLCVPAVRCKCPFQGPCSPFPAPIFLATTVIVERSGVPRRTNKAPDALRSVHLVSGDGELIAADGYGGDGHLAHSLHGVGRTTFSDSFAGKCMTGMVIRAGVAVRLVSPSPFENDLSTTANGLRR